MVSFTRRKAIRLVLGVTAAAGAVNGSQAAADEFWFDLKSDDGTPVSNTRLPGELTGELAALPGVIWAGAKDDALTLYEFYDDNCPYCRSAVKDIDQILHAAPDLRLGLINNAILSPRSVASAKIELAMLKLKGTGAAYRLQQRLLKTPGATDGERALQFGAELGADPALLRKQADSAETKAMLDRQMQAAANLGLSVTPAFVLGNSAITGYPGPNSLAKMIAAGRTCGEPVC